MVRDQHTAASAARVAAMRSALETRMQSTQASQYKGTADCFMQIARNEGLTMFYSGALARCFRVVPGQGIIFMTAEYFYNVLNDKFGKKSKN